MQLIPRNFGEFFGMAAHKGNIDRDIKTLFIREIKSLNQPFGMNVLCTEKKILVFLEDMCHVVAGTVSPVPDKYDLLPGNDDITVNHNTESFVLIFEMNRLDEGIRISMLPKIIESIQMHTVKAPGRMSHRHNILKFWLDHGQQIRVSA